MQARYVMKIQMT